VHEFGFNSVSMVPCPSPSCPSAGHATAGGRLLRPPAAPPARLGRRRGGALTLTPRLAQIPDRTVFISNYEIAQREMAAIVQRQRGGATPQGTEFCKIQ
jgi:hypothetical protein